MYFIYSSVYLLIPNSWFIPLPWFHFVIWDSSVLFKETKCWVSQVTCLGNTYCSRTKEGKSQALTTCGWISGAPAPEAPVMGAFSESCRGPGEASSRLLCLPTKPAPGPRGPCVKRAGPLTTQPFPPELWTSWEVGLRVQTDGDQNISFIPEKS